MIYAIISDIHANLEALSVAINRFIGEGVTEILCCGDLVGYGPDPGPCISFLRRYNFQSVLGNHDKAILTDTLSVYFNEEAVVALNIQKRIMNSEDLAFLTHLPLQIIKKKFVVTHSFLDKKRPFKYVSDLESAAENLRMTRKPIIFCGHTHIPGIFSISRDKSDYFPITESTKIQLDPKKRYVINVGSIGQSRDCDSRLSFAIYDSEKNTIQWFRLSYPLEKTQEKMKNQGFPAFLYERLTQGI